VKISLFKRRPPGRDDVRAELEWILDHAWAVGLADATLTAASFHGRVCSNADAPDDLMPTCISVMQESMRPGDAIVAAGDRQADFAVRYRLEPRRSGHPRI